MDNLNDATKPDILADGDAPGVMLSENNAEVNLIIKEFEDELQAKVFIVIFTHNLCFIRVNIVVFKPGCDFLYLSHLFSETRGQNATLRTPVTAGGLSHNTASNRSCG